MTVVVAYVCVILIWSTTPLAIKWSSGGDVSFAFGVLGRMSISVVLCLLIMAIVRERAPFHRDALRAYLASGAGAFIAMLCVYWGSQYIASGLVSVLFGFTPFATALFAAWALKENSLTVPKITGMAMGVGGLGLIFSHSFSMRGSALQGILAVMVAVLIHSVSGVYAKRYTTSVSALSLTTGGLVLAVPLYFITWLLVDGHWPRHIASQAMWSILYLGVFGSAFGFIMYYYVLKRMETASVALITLVTPVIALFIGSTFNHEQLTNESIAGAGLIVVGLLCFHWKEFARRLIKIPQMEVK